MEVNLYNSDCFNQWKREMEEKDELQRVEQINQLKENIVLNKIKHSRVNMEKQ